jgi:ribonuclease HI
VLLHESSRREVSGGFRRTTNNRMEMMAAIAALEALKEPCQVTLYSDSQYLVNAMSRGWAQRWRANGWKRNKRELAVNPDLWARLLDLCQYHTVEFLWVRGHAGTVENERADHLAGVGGNQPDLPVDEGYVVSG